MPNFFYHQKTGGDEQWRVIPEKALDQVKGSMFVTVLAVSEVVPEDASKEDYSKLRYRGPLYFDLDDAESPASTAKHLLELVAKLEDQGVDPEQLEIYASGGKGFHMLVDEGIFMADPNTKGLPNLPAIYKEMAFNLAVESLDVRVYTARKGRMFRQRNVKRPNGLYKVAIELAEVRKIAEAGKDEAEALYREICSEPRRGLDVAPAPPTMAADLLGMFEEAKAKINKLQAKRKDVKPIKLPESTPSFDGMLRGEGIDAGAGFHQLALQIAITAHAKGMSRANLIAAAEGLIESHQSDGSRYNSASKRRAELMRMWDYTEDNPCYEYNAKAVVSLLTHKAPDLQGVSVTEEDHAQSVAEGKSSYDDDEFSHAGVILSPEGIFKVSSEGPTRLTPITFTNVHELNSSDTDTVSEMEGTLQIGERYVGRAVLDLETLSTSARFNNLLMRHGNAFVGNDFHVKGVYLRLVEKARKSGNRMYTTSREGLDFISLPAEDNRELREGFLVWADGFNVKAAAGDKLNLRFAGYPDARGVFKTDLSRADPLSKVITEHPEEFKIFLRNWLTCQNVTHISKVLGWTVACFYKAIFQKAFGKFPLLHINGAAGAGKTEMTSLFANLHYFMQEVKVLTPSSSLFAIQQTATSSASIPLIVDEYKPGSMDRLKYARFTELFREAYNGRNVERGGGSKENSDYRSLHSRAISAPICFIAETSEQETAVMERVVLVTLSKPTLLQAQTYYRRFRAAQLHKEWLGCIGMQLAATVLETFEMESFLKEFQEVYDDTRYELMLTERDKDLTEEEYRKKAGAKERTVYNYSVARFGLRKFRELLASIYGAEFSDMMQEMHVAMTSSVDSLQIVTVPEWLKVLNELTLMLQLDPQSPYYPIKGKDFAFSQHNGKDVLELNPYTYFAKYAIFCGTVRKQPLFREHNAFAHALINNPAHITNTEGQVVKGVPGGACILSMQELQNSGFTFVER